MKVITIIRVRLLSITRIVMAWELLRTTLLRYVLQSYGGGKKIKLKLMKISSIFPSPVIVTKIELLRRDSHWQESNLEEHTLVSSIICLYGIRVFILKKTSQNIRKRGNAPEIRNVSGEMVEN